MDSLAVAIQGDERISVKESSSQYSVRSKDDDYSVYGLPSVRFDLINIFFSRRRCNQCFSYARRTRMT